jgi:SAM-dependent methyltransferase
VSYGPTGEAWEGFPRYIGSLIHERGARRICDIGGGANPLFAADFIGANKLEYSLLDISQAELDKAPDGYEKILADIAAPDFAARERFDMVFSKMLAEHVRDASRFHANVHKLLRKGGIAVHFFPTLFTLPFVANYLIPERLANALWASFSPRDAHQHAKFPAYYHWCRGPTSRQLGRFSALGYRVVAYRGFFGHGDYYRRLPLVRALHEVKTRYLLRNPSPMFTSYAYLVLERAE